MNRPNVFSRSGGWRRGGFTLVELLVVMGVISVLIALLLPALSKAMRAAKAAQCLSNERQIATALIMYANDNKGAMPGIEYGGGHNGWAFPYDNRPYVGQVLSGGYPKQPPGSNGAGNVAYYSNAGLLCFRGYLQWSQVLYCPGRESSDPLSWEGMYPMWFGPAYKTSEGYQAGWWIWSGTGSATTMAGYLTATTNRSATRTPDFGKRHRLGRAYSDTPLVLDLFWYGEGRDPGGPRAGIQHCHLRRLGPMVPRSRLFIPSRFSRLPERHDRRCTHLAGRMHLPRALWPGERAGHGHGSERQSVAPRLGLPGRRRLDWPELVGDAGRRATWLAVGSILRPQRG